MAYQELIKNFNRIREYMREFYIYGFKSRNEYHQKSARSYDDERRRIESWLNEFMSFKQTNDGKIVFIAIDSRIINHNPLYKAWKTKSFTDGDITLHFIIFDILNNASQPISLNEIMIKIDSYLNNFDNPKLFDISTIRKKLKEYENEGIIITSKQAKTLYYQIPNNNINLDQDSLDFFSEIAPCGVIGSFLLDKINHHDDHFAFKHHYITSALDSEVLYNLFIAIHDRCSITMTYLNRYHYSFKRVVIPLKIMISVQNGRQYLMAYSPNTNRISSFRIDNIISIEINSPYDEYDLLQIKLSKMMKHLWGVSSQAASQKRLEHVEFMIKYEDYEQFIPQRLEREKRCGIVEHLPNNTSRFRVDVYDSSELIPWIRSFIGRITYINFSNKTLEKQFIADIYSMYDMYGIEGD